MIVNINKYHQPDLSKSWSLLIAKAMPAIIINIKKIITNIAIIKIKAEGVEAIATLIKSDARLTKTENRVAHQYSDLELLVLKSFHLTKKLFTAFKKFINTD